MISSNIIFATGFPTCPCVKDSNTRDRDKEKSILILGERLNWLWKSDSILDDKIVTEKLDCFLDDKSCYREIVGLEIAMEYYK